MCVSANGYGLHFKVHLTAIKAWNMLYKYLLPLLMLLCASNALDTFTHAD